MTLHDFCISVTKACRDFKASLIRRDVSLTTESGEPKPLSLDTLCLDSDQSISLIVKNGELFANIADTELVHVFVPDLEYATWWLAMGTDVVIGEIPRFVLIGEIDSEIYVKQFLSNGNWTNKTNAPLAHGDTIHVSGMIEAAAIRDIIHERNWGFCTIERARRGGAFTKGFMVRCYC